MSVLPPPAYYLFLLAGESQQSSDTSGSLITGFKSVGNLIRLQLKKQTGEWSLRMVSTHHYTLKVIGETSVFFYFTESHKEDPLQVNICHFVSKI